MADIEKLAGEQFLTDPNPSMARRILLGMSSQMIARFANALTTVALVPILISSWGVQGYGEWVALLALISYASYANFGVVTIGGNDVVMAIGARDVARAQRSFQNALTFNHIIVIPMLVAIAFFLSFLPFERILNLQQISNSNATAVAWVALLQIAFVTYRGMLGSVLNGHGKYAANYLTDGCFRLAELLAVTVAVLWLGVRQTGLASVLAVSAALELVVVFVVVRRTASGLEWWRLRPLEKSWVRALSRPAIGFSLANLSTQSILLQGPRIALGVVSGGGAVALFNVYAIVLRLADQVVMLISSPLEVEVEQAWHRDETERAYHLVVLGTQASLYLLFLCGVMLVATGPWIFPNWTAGRIPFDSNLLLFMLAVALATQLGRISANTLIAANRIFAVAGLMLPIALGTVALGAALATRWGVWGMAAALLIGELVLSFLMLRAVQAWTGAPGASVLRDLLNVRDLARISTRVVRRLFLRRA